MHVSTRRCRHLYVDALSLSRCIYIYMLLRSSTLRSANPNAMTWSYRTSHTPRCGFHFPPTRLTCCRRANSVTVTRTGTRRSAGHLPASGSQALSSTLRSTVLNRFCFVRHSESAHIPDDSRTVKPGGMRLAHESCHPECNEGSRHEILRSAQNDSAEEPQHKVSECFAFQFRRNADRLVAQPARLRIRTTPKSAIFPNLILALSPELAFLPEVQGRPTGSPFGGRSNASLLHGSNKRKRQTRISSSSRLEEYTPATGTN